MIKKQKIIDIVSKALGAKVNEKSNNKNVKKWDSLGQLQILAALDNFTKGKSSKVKGLDTADSVKKIIKLLDK